MSIITKPELIAAAAPTAAPTVTPAVTPTVTCGRCAAPLADEQRYCLQCGEPTELAVPHSRPQVPPASWQAATNSVVDGVAPVAQAAPATTPLSYVRPADAQRAIDTQSQHPSTESRYVVFGAAGATAILLTALVAGFVGAGFADEGNSQPAAVVQPAAAATGATAAVAAPFVSDWPVGTSAWTVIIKQFEKPATQPAQVTAFKNEVSTKGLTAGALDSDQFGSLDAGKFVVYSGQYEKQKQADKALKDVKSKGYPEASVVEVSSDSDSGSKSSETLGSDELKKLDDLSPEESAKQRLKLPDETSTEGEAPPTDEKDPGGGSDELTIGSLGDHFGLSDDGANEVVGFDVNSLQEVTCVWPLQTGTWTVGRALRLAPGVPAGWTFPSPVNDFFSGSATTPGATFCPLEEHGISAALAFKGRYATAAAARKALRNDAEMKALGAHIVRVIPLPGSTPST